MLNLLFLAMLAIASPNLVKAMKPMHCEPQNEKYSFVGMIQSISPLKKITFVKQLADNKIVFFDKHGCGEIHDPSGQVNPTRLCRLTNESIPCNIFNYQDLDNKSLLIASDGHSKKLYVFNLDGTDTVFAKDLWLGETFTLYQCTNQNLLMSNTNNEIFVINPQWIAAELQHLKPNTVLVRRVPNNEQIIETIRDEGTIVTTMAINENSSNSSLSPKLNIFDFQSPEFSSLSQEERKKVLLNSNNGRVKFRRIHSYHKIKLKNYNDEATMLICGHNGFITCWRLNHS